MARLFVTLIACATILLTSFSGTVSADEEEESLEETCKTLLEQIREIRDEIDLDDLEDQLPGGPNPPDLEDFIPELTAALMVTAGSGTQLCREPNLPEACSYLAPALREIQGQHQGYTPPTHPDYGGPPPVLEEGSETVVELMEEYLIAEEDGLLFCDESIPWDLCGYVSAPCDLLYQASDLAQEALVETFGMGADHLWLLREESDDQAQHAGKDPEDAPWLRAQCRTARTETGDQGKSGGEWRIVIPTESIDASPQNAYGPQNEDSGAFKSFGRLSLDFPDRGTIEQDICFDPGEWNPISPPTRTPAGNDQVEHEAITCLVGGGVFIIGAVGVVAGVATANPGLALAGAGLATTGFLMAVDHCPKTVQLMADDGYMKCRGHAEVTWGGGESGNRYSSTILDAGPLEVTSHSHGGGRDVEEFPANVNDQVLYDGPGYEKGEAICDRELNDHRKAAYARYREWEHTDSDPDSAWGTSASATITATLDVQTLPVAEIPESWEQLSKETFLDHAGDALWLGCEEVDCTLEVELSVNSCGRQVLTPGTEQVTYEFIGAPDCLDVELVVAGEEIGADLPLLRLDGEFGGAGGNPIV